MLIDALVPIDCRAASFRHLPSRRRATIIPITRPPLLTLIDAPFSPGLSRYTKPLRASACGRFVKTKRAQRVGTRSSRINASLAVPSATLFGSIAHNFL